MQCPYCYKRVKDVPDHLKKSKNCQEKHHRSLAIQFKHMANKNGIKQS